MSIKKAIALAIPVLGVLAMNGCYVHCHGGHEPHAPYGYPDAVERYDSHGYASVTYIYYCLDGYYVEVRYSRQDHCSDYYEEYEIERPGWCYYQTTDGAEAGTITESSATENGTKTTEGVATTEKKAGDKAPEVTTESQ